MNTAERKIFTAHKQAALYCNVGESPTDALVKVANESDLNPEMTRRVSQMLNISLTKAFMKSASDKTESFPLANCEQAIKRVFSSEPEAKVASLESSIVGGVDWGCAGASMVINRKHDKSQDHSFFKAAKELNNQNLNDLVQQSEGAKAVLKNEISKKAQDLYAIENKILTTYTGLISHFRQSGNHTKYAAFENQCYGEYGEGVKHYLDAIYGHLNDDTVRGTIEHAKVAAIYRRNETNDTFDLLMDYTEELKKVAQELFVTQDTHDSFNRQIEDYYKQAMGGSLAPSATDDMLDFSVKKAEFSLLSDPRLEAAVTSHSQQGTGAFAKGLEAEHDRIYKRPGDEADMEVENVRRQAILADLMSNDDIIAGQEPHHIQSAYNTLLQISPKSTLHREVVRSVLRNATAQQSIDPFTAKQLADLEGQHLKNEAAAKGKPLPATA